MSNARKLADNLPTEGQLGNRNLLYNGKHEVAQRGTSFSSAGNVIYLTDRWHIPIGSSFNLDTTLSQSTTVPTGQGFKYSLKVEADTVQTPSGSHNGGIAQKLEGQDVQHLAYGTSSAKSVTLSFWVRSNKTGVYCCQLQTNHYGGSSQYGHVKEYTISAANTWEKKILTFPGLTAQTIDTVTGDGLRVLWWLACGSTDHVSADSWIQSASYAATSNQVNFMDSASNEWYLTGCQLEEGSQASPFEHEQYSVTLAKCQRYAYVFKTDNTNGIINIHQDRLTQGYIGNIIMPVEMRTAPTVTHVGMDRVHKPGIRYDTISSGPAFSFIHTQGFVTTMTAATNDVDSQTAYFGAVSGGTITADAEL